MLLGFLFNFGIIELVFFLPFLGWYFVPTIVAVAKKKKNLPIIFLINLFLGWTILGWIVALILSVRKS